MRVVEYFRSEGLPVQLSRVAATPRFYKSHRSECRRLPRHQTLSGRTCELQLGLLSISEQVQRSFVAESIDRSLLKSPLREMGVTVLHDAQYAHLYCFYRFQPVYFVEHGHKEIWSCLIAFHCFRLAWVTHSFPLRHSSFTSGIRTRSRQR
jgi:hypothetical protein